MKINKYTKNEQKSNLSDYICVKLLYESQRKE